MLTYLTLGITFAFAAAIEPGPLQAYLLSQTLAHGWQRTILACFAPILSDAPIIAVCLFILSHVPSAFLQSLQIIGGIYLIYLAVEAIRTYRNYNAEQALQPSSQNTLIKAVVVNLLNPNPYLAWSLVMGPLLIKAWQETPINGVALIAAFYATMVVCLFGTIMLFSAFRNLGAAINRILIGVSGIALGGFGLFEIWTGMSALL
jgi:threonine/homoserine/homoserine lactone efflux protein